MKITQLDKVEQNKVDMEGARGAYKQVPVGIADQAPNFSMRVFTLEPGGFTPYHNHPWEHENYILKGEGVMLTETGEEKPIKAGDFAIVLPNEQHQFKNTSATDELQFICLVPKEYE